MTGEDLLLSRGDHRRLLYDGLLAHHMRRFANDATVGEVRRRAWSDMRDLSDEEVRAVNAAVVRDAFDADAPRLPEVIDDVKARCPECDQTPEEASVMGPCPVCYEGI